MAVRVCSIADSLAVVGERWSLLIVRELSLGVHRFSDIVANTGAPRDILTTRLKTLEALNVISREQYSERPPRFDYHLTRAGWALTPVLLMLRSWGDEWLNDEPPVLFEHDCGKMLVPRVHCEACGKQVEKGSVHQLETV